MRCSKFRPALICLPMAAALLAACDSGVWVNRSEGVNTYTADYYVQTLAQNGTNAVLVRNGPFGPQGDEAALTALRNRYASGQYRFTLGPTASDWNGYTVVLRFGRPVGNGNPCRADLPPPTVQPGTTVLQGDYCYGDRVVSEATGYAGAVSGPNDPQYAKLVAEVVAELFQNRQRDPNGGGPSPPG